MRCKVVTWDKVKLRSVVFIDMTILTLLSREQKLVLLLLDIFQRYHNDAESVQQIFQKNITNNFLKKSESFVLQLTGTA